MCNSWLHQSEQLFYFLFSTKVEIDAYKCVTLLMAKSPARIHPAPPQRLDDWSSHHLQGTQCCMKLNSGKAKTARWGFRSWSLYSMRDKKCNQLLSLRKAGLNRSKHALSLPRKKYTKTQSVCQIKVISHDGRSCRSQGHEGDEEFFWGQSWQSCFFQL